MDKEYSNGRMVRYMMDLGFKDINTELRHLQIGKAKVDKVSGKMVKE